MTKKASKIFLYSFLSFVVLLLCLAGYTQTAAFRSNLRSALYEVIKDNLNASVYFGEINGNLVTGFSIDTVMMYIDNAPFIESGKISVRYNLFDLLSNEVNVDSLAIQNPVVHLTRWNDGTWNVDRLTEPSPTSDSTPSLWKINARKIVLMNASFRLVDSTGRIDSSVYINGRKSINYSNLYLNEINLNAGVSYASDRITADIWKLSFVSPREKFTLSSLSTAFYYTNNSARAVNLTILSPHTSIRTSAEIEGIDIFSAGDLPEFENVPVKLTLEESEISTSDLQVFLPELYFLTGKVKIDGAFQGTFRQLNVNSLNASFGKTSLALNGTISNIHHPEDLRLNIVSKQSSINPPDVPQLLPYFGIPLYSQLGQLTLDFQFVGKPLDFVVISKVQSAAGTVTVDGEMLITEENLHYKGLLAGNNVNLEKIFESSDFASHINTKAFIEGEGTSIETLNAEARIEIDSSSVRGIPVSSATLELKAKERTIDADIALNSTEVNLQTAALLDFRNIEPSYMLSTRVRNLNLASMLRDEYYDSHLSFDIHRTAKTFDILDGISNTNIQILPSKFKDHSFDSSLIRIVVALDSSSQRNISVQSPIVDGELKGTFDFNGFLKTLQRGVHHITQLYTYQRRVVDSTFNERSIDTVRIMNSDSTQNEIRYALTVKNLRPIALFFKLPMMDAQATLDGVLAGNEQSAELTGSMQMQRGLIVSDSTIVQIKQTSLEYSLRDLPSFKPDDPLPLKVELSLDGNEIDVNKTVLKYPKTSFSYDGTAGEYKVYSDVDTTISIALEGSVTAHEGEELLNISLLNLIYQGYDIRNSNPVIGRLSRKGVSLDSALFEHRDQKLLLDGTYSFNGAVDAVVQVTNFSLQDLYYFSSSSDFRENALAFGGTVSAKSLLTGTIRNPSFWVQMGGEDFSFKQTSFGHMSGVVTYTDKVADVRFELHHQRDSVESKDLTLSGKIPVDLRFINVENRTDLEGMDLQFTTSNLQMAALDPFIPELTIVGGIVKSDLHVSGSLKHPLFSGTAKLDSGRWILEMTGISYLANGTLLFDGNNVSFPEFSVRNLSGDYSDGLMKVGGFVTLKGFVPDEYHLAANGELMVLHERSRAQGSAFFGTLIASTGSDSMRFDGNFDRSRVSGVVYIQQASLTFPPTQQASSYSSSLFNTVEFIDDTSRQIIDTTAVESVLTIVQQLLAQPKSNERTFLDGFGYDLTIQTRGSVRVNMIFNANAGAYEELYAELDGKLALSKNENGLQLKGSINVGNQSKYTFYKEFNASGSLTFDGDPQNPRLGITATYEGTHCINSGPLKDDCAKEERVIVTLNISGTRLLPQVKLGLKTIDQNGKETIRSGEVENDAISFLLTSSSGTPGKFRDELTAQDRDRISEQLTSTIGGTFLNSMLSGYVMEFITRNNIPFVKRVEVSDVGADPNINVRVEIFDAIINAGGRVFSNINNTNISIQRPILGKENRNFMLEVEKKTENFNYSLESRTILSARIFYRFTF
ncbi:MAG: hypothetical protein AB1728_04140 [Bacteroidota bacterium]